MYQVLDSIIFGEAATNNCLRTVVVGVAKAINSQYAIHENENVEVVDTFDTRQTSYQEHVILLIVGVHGQPLWQSQRSHHQELVPEAAMENTQTTNGTTRQQLRFSIIGAG